MMVWTGWGSAWTVRPRLLILEIDLRAVTWPRKPLALALKTTGLGLENAVLEHIPEENLEGASWSRYEPHVGCGTEVPCGLRGWKMAVCGKRQLPGCVCPLCYSFECVLCCSLGSLFVFHYFMFLYVLSIDLVRLSVPVQLINWKDMAMKWPVM